MNHTQEQGTREIKGQSLDQLFTKHYKASLRTAYRILHTKEDSEDAVQTAYYIAFRELNTFRYESSFATWVNRIVVNCCLGQLRQRRSRSQVAFDEIECAVPIPAPLSVSPEVLCYQREMQVAQQHAASKLPRSLQEVYAPCAIAGATFSEVAGQLGLTAGAAKSRLSRARKRVEHTLRAQIQRRAA